MTRRHRTISGWILATISAAAQKLSDNRRKQLGTPAMRAVLEAVLRDEQQLGFECCRFLLGESSKSMRHIVTYTHCVSLLNRGLHHGFVSAKVEEFWNNELLVTVPDPLEREGFIAAVNLWSSR